ncbi:hypothetical protein RZN05_19890 [Sphingomonas sp. HF-S4]|uniref:Lipoprotein n=1 Tax=Sphingomonas agrestis TaxID=3080540 RepID=A0ABU3YDP9_9SPHN|nr:hypothetical protein [Sphingomonas sp. HF-S4]MDV3459267.1 hypothetical protein [Sphingomonas sp. HF-S4]
MAYRAPVRILAGLVCLALAGCQEGAELRVTQDDRGVSFSLAPDTDTQRCIDAVTVYPKTPDDAAPLWDISRDRSVKGCTTQLRYGELPAGFGARQPAATLPPGAAYRVMVSGVGFSAAAQFTRTP